MAVACGSRRSQEDDVAVEPRVVGQVGDQRAVGDLDRSAVRGTAQRCGIGDAGQLERELERVLGGQRLRWRRAGIEPAVDLGIAVEGRQHGRDRDAPVVALRLEQLPVADADHCALAGLQVAEIGGVEPVALGFDQHRAVAAVDRAVIGLARLALRPHHAREGSLAEVELQSQQHGARRDRERVDDFQRLAGGVDVVLLGGEVEQRSGGARTDAHALEDGEDATARGLQARVLFVLGHGFRSLRMVAYEAATSRKRRRTCAGVSPAAPGLMVSSTPSSMTR